MKDKLHYDFDMIKHINATKMITFNIEEVYFKVGDIVEYKEWPKYCVHKCEVKGVMFNPLIASYNIWLEVLETRNMKQSDLLKVVKVKSND